MDSWNAEQYLKFEQQRTQPARDLASSAAYISPKTVIDIGCGPGNSTAVLRQVFPDAKITGADNSPRMIEKAKANYPELDFELCAAREIRGKYDLVFSNACLQWVPDHRTLIPFLMEHLNDGGVLAVQMPMNSQEPLYRIADEVISSGRWDFSSAAGETNLTLPTQEYYDILSSCSSDFDLWETVYYHHMPDHESLVDWIKSTKLRPYLAALGEAEAQDFLAEITEKTKAVYRKAADGSIIFRFRRFFFTAKK